MPKELFDADFRVCNADVMTPVLQGITLEQLQEIEGETKQCPGCGEFKHDDEFCSTGICINCIGA